MVVAKINLWGNLVGAVLWDDKNGYARFEFDADFLKLGLDIAPIIMPLEHALAGKRLYSFPTLSKETYKGLPGLLADSLPDHFGNILIDAWLAQQGRTPNSMNAVERLCYTGKRGMGALEFEPASRFSNEQSGLLEIKELVALAKNVLSEKRDLKANIHAKSNKELLEIIRVGTSAGGARAKAVIAYNQKTGDVKSGQVASSEGYDYWIIKFDGVTNKELGDPKGYGKIEYAYHQMAIDCGIEMSECRLLTENKRTHFMTKRFDRYGDNKKLHLQTLCAIAHFDYNLSGAYSYEQAFQIMRQLRLPYKDAEQLFMRMTFNVIARNQDDHTKNISFLMDEDGTWKLAPAYDVTYAFDPLNKWMKQHQMTINGKRENINRKDVLKVAKEMNIKKPNNLIDEIVRSVKKWKKFAAKLDMPTTQIDAIATTHILTF
jgi:serine/threonine-protein kinase HipA